jgi:NADH:ubiquinone oxidoreductase subunit 6 (subunit J)
MFQRQSFPYANKELGFEHGSFDYVTNGSLEIVHFKALACIAFFQFIILLIFIIPAMKSLIQIILLYIFVSLFGAGLILGIGGEFFFLTLLLVTIGAIAILYLFIVMVTDLRTAYLNHTVTSAKFILTFIYFGLVLFLLVLLSGTLRLEYYTKDLTFFVSAIHGAVFFGLDMAIVQVNNTFIFEPLAAQGMSAFDVLDNVELRRSLLLEHKVEMSRMLGMLVDEVCPLAVEAVLEVYKTQVTELLNPIYDETAVWVKAASQGSMLDIHGLGNLIFGHAGYSILVVLAGFILIFALIGSIVLTLENRLLLRARIMGVQNARSSKSHVKSVSGE